MEPGRFPGAGAQSTDLVAPLLAELEHVGCGLHPASPPDPPPLLAAVMGTLERPAWPSPWELKGVEKVAGGPAALPATGTAVRAHAMQMANSAVLRGDAPPPP